MAKDKTTAELAAEEQDAIAKALGEPDPLPPEPKPAKPDTRTAIERERDEQRAVERAVHGITIVEGKP